MGKEDLLQAVGKKVIEVKRREKYELVIKLEKLQEVTTWLRKNSGLAMLNDSDFREDDMSLFVNIDEVTYHRYLKEFEPEQFEEKTYDRKKVWR